MRALLLLVLLLAAPAARPQTHLALLPESRVTLRGSSTLHRFACTAAGVQGTGTHGEGASAATLTVRVADLDCGSRRMTDDLRATLRAEHHPTIVFTMAAARLVGGDAARFTLAVEGRLTLAGTTRPVSLTVEAARHPDGTYAATATVPLSVRAFALEPPSALLGLVRVHDRIDVDFHLRAQERAPAARR